MKVAKSIAIARRLLADGRAADVARMLEPLYGAAGDPVLGSLLARVALLHAGDPVAAARLASTPAPRATPAEAVEADFWRHWAGFRAGMFSPLSALAAFESAGASFRARARMADWAWTRIAGAEACDALGEPVLAGAYREDAVHVFHLLPDAQAAAILPDARGARPDWLSPVMQEADTQFRRLGPSRLPLWLVGERGTGKRTYARAVHDAATRRGPFVAVTLDRTAPEGAAGLAATAFEAHWEEAAGGTLFIEEVTVLPRDLQRRLAGWLTNPPAGDGPRVVASSTTGVAGRTSVLDPLLHACFVPGTLPLPRLARRREDLPLLIRRFLGELTPAGSPVACLTDAAFEALADYTWPGHLRQLRNELERVIALVGSEPVPVIEAGDLSPELRTRTALLPEGERLPEGAGREASLDDQLAEAERQAIEHTLRRLGGRISATAEALGLTRQGLHKKMKRLGIDAVRPPAGWATAGQPHR
jgi:transcriptional regulator with AAA-type ATPase domain